MRQLKKFWLAISFPFALLAYSAGAQDAAPAPTPAPSAESPAPVTDGTKVRLVTWNLEWYPGLKPQPPLEAEIEAEKNLIRSLPSLEADIICVQEVVGARSLQRAVNELPGFKLNVITDFADAAQEMGIASRFPTIEAGDVAYTANGDVHPPRGFAFAALDIGEGDVLVVYSVHLKSNRGGDPGVNYAVREESAIQLTRHALATVERLKAAEKRRVSVLVAGDFNSDPANGKWVGDGTWNAFAKADFKWGWEGVPDKDRNSWIGSDRYEPTCFDHIMILARDGLTAGKAHLLAPTVPAGDHLPVALEVVW